MTCMNFKSTDDLTCQLISFFFSKVWTCLFDRLPSLKKNVPLSSVEGFDIISTLYNQHFLPYKHKIVDWCITMIKYPTSQQEIWEKKIKLNPNDYSIYGKNTIYFQNFDERNESILY